MKSHYESPFLDQEALEFLRSEEEMDPAGLEVAEATDYLEAELLTEQGESPKEARLRLEPQRTKVETFETLDDFESVEEEAVASGEEQESETAHEDESLAEEEASEAEPSLEANESEDYPGALESLTSDVDEESELSLESMDEEELSLASMEEEEQDWELDFEEESILNEEVAVAPEPLAVPRTNPIPFAPAPKAAGYWPVRTTSGESREVNYRQVDGTLVGKRRARRFLAPRSSGKRVHLGVDLAARVNDPVLACEPGTVVAFYPFSCRRSKNTYALLIEHPQVVALYGGIQPDSLKKAGLMKGAKVKAGQIIGSIGQTPGGKPVLHFETWAKGTMTNQEWVVSGKRPRQLLNPTRYLLALT